MENSHEFFMNRCLNLAVKGSGWVNPNPMVGSVIVHNNHIIAEGYHARFGQAHAERMAILSVQNKELLKQSTIYVTLEPCSHFGKTPPCADLIVEFEIPRVVVGMKDPNSQVNGMGIQKLQNKGIQVVEQVLNEQCIYLNRKFYVNQLKNRPFITLKWAETASGYYAPLPKSKTPISGDICQKYTHRLRQSHQAILVGIGTWLMDKPLLNDRYFEGPQPIKLVLNGAELWCFDTQLDANSPEIINIPQDQDTATFISDFCFKKGWYSLLVEGGHHAWNAFIDSNLVDEALVYRSKNTEFNEGLISPWDALTACFPQQEPHIFDLDTDELILFQWKK
jgi:diaminohydroxyphosphoribosylaminopyrimidine deaminase/5-amino-6-(5-phosphoribosylamino)uracil reductase